MHLAVLTCARYSKSPSYVLDIAEAAKKIPTDPAMLQLPVTEAFKASDIAGLQRHPCGWTCANPGSG